MAPPPPLHQASAFYPPPWNEEMDRWCISVLVREALNGHYRAGQHNHSAMSLAISKVNTAFETNFDVKYGFERLMLWRVRYRLFKWLTRLSGVTYDPITHHVGASDDAWEFICEKEPLARAYIKVGEKEYDHFKLLFEDGTPSPEIVHNVDSAELIDLSTDEDEGEGQKVEKGKGRPPCVTLSDNTSAHDANCSNKGTDFQHTPQSKGKRKRELALGEEGSPDNEWWDDVARGDPNDQGDEASSESAYSSTEMLKKRDHIMASTHVGRKLFSEDSSSASFSPVKKI